jgi:hypothetical protein
MEQSLKNHREYFYTIQKDILQNIINFQNFFLFNYEDTLKNLMSQLVILLEISNFFLVEEDSKSVYTYNFEKFDYMNISHAININQSKVEDRIFFMFENDSMILDDSTEIFIKMSSRIISIFKTFRIPYYGDKQLFDGMAIYLNKTKEIYSMNNTFFYNFINNEIGGEYFNEFYLNLTKVMVEAYVNPAAKILADNSLYLATKPARRDAFDLISSICSRCSPIFICSNSISLHLPSMLLLFIIRRISFQSSSLRQALFKH